SGGGGGGGGRGGGEEAGWGRGGEGPVPPVARAAGRGGHRCPGSGSGSGSPPRGKHVKWGGGTATGGSPTVEEDLLPGGQRGHEGRGVRCPEAGHRIPARLSRITGDVGIGLVVSCRHVGEGRAVVWAGGTGVQRVGDRAPTEP